MATPVKPSFRNPRSQVPPGGVWFFQIGDERVESPVYDLAVRYTANLMQKHGMAGDPVTELAKYMCPHMPEWFCNGATVSSPAVMPATARENAPQYFLKDVETHDTIRKRMRQCMDCPMHRRDFCLHCTGYDTWVRNGFRGKRPALPEDDASGCCRCAKTFEAAIASVVYGKDEPIWEGAPSTCWRFNV